MIRRYSSRQRSLAGFLPELLEGAHAYDRIAGYFRSSMLEIAGESIETMAEGAVVRVIANSDLSPFDVKTARAAKLAMYKEWRSSLPEDITPSLRERLDRLHHFLSSGRLQVRVLPDSVFGFVHGKAGVIERANGTLIAFVGSANESRSAWKSNYEIVWTDESVEAVAWTRAEFEALWLHPAALDLADGVVKDVERVTRRIVIPDVPGWKKGENAEPAAAAIELPIYRRENGLWAHQKVFVQQAFEAHQNRGARLVLADQVGLGKTVQLALAAKLMILWGGGNVLVVVPKPLLHQWQDEIWHLLQLPSAIWTGKAWVDEVGVEHPVRGPEDLQNCPRKVGIVSAGLITQSSEAAEQLKNLRYECVIVDEAHKARRRNLGPTHRNGPADPNNLLRFLRDIARQTTSMLLATATPVQLDPIEAFDLLHALNGGNRSVLGLEYSQWITKPRLGLEYILGRQDPPKDIRDAWSWIRDPFPPAGEGRDFAVIRSALGMPPTQHNALPEALDKQLGPSDRQRLANLCPEFFAHHNPYIRHIVRRTRKFLEENVDPETHEPYLPPVHVRLFGEGENEAVVLPTFLRDAYDAAEQFCEEIGRRSGRSAGLLKTLLLRRIGSTIIAGRKTAEAMLGGDPDEEGEEDDEAPRSRLHPLNDAEREHLERCVKLLRDNTIEDPKYQVVGRLLRYGASGTEPWLDRGCIIFSQYLDSAEWVAAKLSVDLPDEPIALYAGGGRSGIYRAGYFTRVSRDTIRDAVGQGEIRLLIGTEAASEGLNLQRLGTLINLDLPWNPTRLEQRKGRIQRIGQARDEVFVYNMRYRDSVEDRVHQLLSQRLQNITDLFGQVPDTLEDVWIDVALHNEEEARKRIDAIPKSDPFPLRYDRIEHINWESCATVLDSVAQIDALIKSW